MKINNRSVQGIYLFSTNHEYEKGDFIVYDEALYICTAGNPTDQDDKTVCGKIPGEDSENFVEYPGERVITKDEYNKIVSGESIIDKYVSSNVLSEILSDTFFGLGESGIIKSKISYNSENKKVSYDIGGATGEYIYGEGESVLDTLLKSSDLNNGMVKVSASLPEVTNILPTKVLDNIETPFYVSGYIIDYDTDLYLDGVSVVEYILTNDGTNTLYTASEDSDSNVVTGEGKFIIKLTSDISRIKISKAGYSTKYVDLSNSEDYLWDSEKRLISFINPIVLFKESPVLETTGYIKDANTGLPVDSATLYPDYKASYVKVNYPKGLTKTSEQDIISNFWKYYSGETTTLKTGLKERIKSDMLYSDETKSYGVFVFDTNCGSSGGDGELLLNLSGTNDMNYTIEVTGYTEQCNEWVTVGSITKLSSTQARTVLTCAQNTSGKKRTGTITLKLTNNNTGATDTCVINVSQGAKYKISDKCIGCGSCSNYCNLQAIISGSPYYSINSDRCTGCGNCVDKCPTGAIVVDDN